MPAETPKKRPNKEELLLLEKKGLDFLQAYAVRCAWRAFPVLGTRANFSYWKQDQQHRFLYGIFAALATCTTFSTNSSRRNVRQKAAGSAVWYAARAAKTTRGAMAAAEAAAAAVSTAIPGAEIAAKVTDRAAWWAASDAWDGQDGSTSASDAADKAHEAVKAAVWNDYQILLIVNEASDLYTHDLWGNAPYEQLGEIEQNFKKACDELDASSLFAHYLAIRKGRTPDLKELERDLQLWEEKYGREDIEKAEMELAGQGIDVSPAGVLPSLQQKGNFDSSVTASAEQTLPPLTQGASSQPELEVHETTGQPGIHQHVGSPGSVTQQEVTFADNFGNTAVALHDERATKDLLGREPLVKALARMFVSPEQGTPFTIGLLGDWGVGKSSVLQLLKQEIQQSSAGTDREFDFAEFNAWEYEKTDNIAAGLAQEVVEGVLAGTGGWWKRQALTIRFAWEVHRAKLVLVTILILLALGTALGIYFSKEFRADVLATLKINSDGGSSLSAIAIWGAMVGGIIYVGNQLIAIFDHPLVSQARLYLKLPEFETHLGVVRVLRKQIDMLCKMRIGYRRWPWYRYWFVAPKSVRKRCHTCCTQIGACCSFLIRKIPWLPEKTHELAKRWKVIAAYKWTANRIRHYWETVLIWLQLRWRYCLRSMAKHCAINRRLIVYIDDLDRCQPDCIADTLDAVRLIMDRRHVIVVIAIDHRIALKAVAENYKSLADDQRSPEDIARDYLGKIIQLPIRLDDPGPDGLETFIKEKLFAGASDGKTEEPTTTQAAASSTTQSAEATSKEPIEEEEQQTEQGEPDKKKPAAESDSPDADISNAATDEENSSQNADNVEEFADAKEDQEDPDSESKSDTKALPPEDTLLKDTTDERDLFLQLARDLAIDNPRRLTRLRNAYRLLKVLADEMQEHFDNAGIPNGFKRQKKLMHVLFWHEFLGQLSEKYHDGFAAMPPLTGGTAYNQMSHALVKDLEDHDSIGMELEQVRLRLSKKHAIFDHVQFLRNKLPSIDSMIENLVLPRKPANKEKDESVDKSE